jgi:NADH-quinone oxidoreductase subunit L
MAVIAVVGVITLFFGGLLALVQDDIKKILAYSTISQLGYMVAAIGVGGYTASIFHLFTHGFFKALLFLGAGSLIHAVHSNNISAMGGLRRFMPFTFWTFTIGSLALAGFPMTAGFFSKDEILISGDLWALNGSRPAAPSTGSASPPRSSRPSTWRAPGSSSSSASTAARRTTTTAHGRHTTRDDAHDHAHDARDAPRRAARVRAPDHRAAHDPRRAVADRRADRLAVPPGAAELRVVDVDPGHREDDLPVPRRVRGRGVGVSAAEKGPSAKILHGPPTWHLDLLLIVLVVFGSAVGLAWRFYGKGLPEKDPMLHMGGFTRMLVNKYGFDDAGYRYVVVPVRDKMSAWATKVSNDVIDGAVAGVGTATMRMARTTYTAVDQRIIDGGVNGAAFSAAWWSARLRRIQSGDVQRYAGALVAGVILLVLAFVAVR